MGVVSTKLRNSAKGQPLRVHMLSVMERLPNSRYRCRCDCGNERIVRVGHFNAGNARSCGCHKPQHGHASRADTSREYRAWDNMIARCHRPKNKRFGDYGAKGIRVCERWRESFAAFIKDMGPCPHGYTIERKDNSDGYAPGNCEWASRSKNQRNRSVSVIWTVWGHDYPTLEDAANAHGVSGRTISSWCKGRTAAGRYYPPRGGCSFRKRYPDSDGGRR